MRVDGRRALRGMVLILWAAFFVWLRLSGEMTRYLGPRTYWVVTFGAIVLSLTGIAHLATLGSRVRRGIAAREIGGAAVMLLPLVAVLLIPNADLGALAASRRSAGGLGASNIIPAPDAGGDVSFAEIVYAGQSGDFAAGLGITDGYGVELLGFVTKHPSRTSLELTRFYVSCCAADAIPYSVEVSALGEDPGDYDTDAWLEVQGTLEKRDDRYVVVADSIEVVPEPRDPYL